MQGENRIKKGGEWVFICGVFKNSLSQNYDPVTVRKKCTNLTVNSVLDQTPSPNTNQSTLRSHGVRRRTFIFKSLTLKLPESMNNALNDNMQHEKCPKPNPTKNSAVPPN